MHRGSCLCGAVRFTVKSDLPPPNACHCSICRKASGHFFASTEVEKRALSIAGAEHLKWYDSSSKVRRGFCGAPLFFDPPHLDWIAIAMGAFDGPSGTALSHHIFTQDKGDYYEIGDGLPQNPQ